MEVNLQKVSMLMLMFLLVGCSSSTSNHNKQESKEIASSESMGPDDLRYILLMNEYRYWAKSPFQLGGNSLSGVDCSSLVQQVFKSSFNITLPRTTELQATKGYSINKKDLEVADLVFFKTGWSTRHVGIYIGNNQFFHASTSKGVIISELSNPYWSEHYWQSRRVID